MAGLVEIPSRLPLLILADRVLLPGSSLRIPVRQPNGMSMVRSRLLDESSLRSTIIGVIPKEPGKETSGSSHDAMTTVHHIGTAAVVVQVTATNWPRPQYTLVVTGLCRIRVESIVQERPYLVARVKKLEAKGNILDSPEEELKALVQKVRDGSNRLAKALSAEDEQTARKFKRLIDSIPAQHLADICTDVIRASFLEKLGVLDAIDLKERFTLTLPLLKRQLKNLELLNRPHRPRPPNGTVVVHRAKSESDALESAGLSDGDDDDDDDEIAFLSKKIRAASMPRHAEKAAVKELKRLKKMPPNMPENGVIRTYLELLVDLPWSKSTPDMLDIEKARADLDADHFGLEKPKKRILEYLAVRQLKNTLKGPILCLVGPPGVGKTSIGKSIANTLGRAFHRISLGGVSDQSDIRGHRRTYIGSMPGRIIHGLKLAKTNNPVFLLDEIDKLNRGGVHGDPSSALLEVLDPEQNHTFTDHYMNVPFDLSQVLFIATANTLSTIPAPLLDRMEVIRIAGYTQEEKTEIAIRHLLAKQYNMHGLSEGEIIIPEETVQELVSKYTLEAGVRDLERTIGAVCRAVAVRVAAYRKKASSTDPPAAAEQGETITDNQVSSDAINSAGSSLVPAELPIVVDVASLDEILGPQKFEAELVERVSQCGVVVGLAWTAMGGKILFVEASAVKGKGDVKLTGQLGSVMKESANLALTWIRAHSVELSLDPALLKDTDVHIHFPAGSISKDGPSAGVAIVTALVSQFSKRPARSDTAMTGEITLRGLVLPVGGIKEKVLAAHRAGIRRVIMCVKNQKDLRKVPTSVQDDITFIWATRVEDVLNAAFEEPFPLMKAGPPTAVVPSKL